MSRYDAVIVGGGPRGVATVLRIAARVAADGSAPPTGSAPAPAREQPDTAPARVAIVDALAVGSGATWLIDQPAEYLNNTQADATTIHPDASTPMSGPPAPGPDLLEWAAEIAAAGTHPRGDWVVEEARGLAGPSFPTRRLQGVYFRDQLDHAIAEGLVQVEEFLGTVVDLAREGEDPVAVLADGTRLVAPTVVLAQGMVQSRRGAEVTTLAEAADRFALRYAPPGMPAERDYTGLPPGGTVLVRGLGANFFDVIGQLAAEWGGTLETVPGDPTARLRYLPSGREPHLVVGSRRGVPYRSKPDGGRPVRRFTPRWATAAWFDALAGRDDVDFAAEVWPVLGREFARCYLEALAAADPDAVTGEWLTDLDVADTQEQIDAALTAAITDRCRLWTLDELHHVTHGEAVGGDQWDAVVARMVEDELGSMSAPATHPRAAVNGAMGALRVQVGRLIAAGSFSGASFAHDVLGWFDGDSLALASGPPADRVRLVLALIEAGVIELLGPEFLVEADEQEGIFRAASPITGRTATSQVLLETRMSKGKVPDTDDPLLRALLDSGRARIHAVDQVETDSLEATGAQTSEESLAGHNLVAADGTVDPSVVVIGIPVLSTQPGSAIGATPGKPSPLLAGADVAAKQVLARR